MAKETEKKKKATYFIDTICNNCGISSKVLEEVFPKINTTIRIPRGTLVKEFLKTAKCLFCGCKETLEKILTLAEQLARKKKGKNNE